MHFEEPRTANVKKKRKTNWNLFFAGFSPAAGVRTGWLVSDMFYRAEVKASPCSENWGHAEECVSSDIKRNPSVSLMHVFPSTFYWSFPSFRIAVIRCGRLAAPCRAVILIRDVFLYARWSWSGRLLLPTSPVPSLLHPSRAEEASRGCGPWEVSPSTNLPEPDNLMVRSRKRGRDQLGNMTAIKGQRWDKGNCFFFLHCTMRLTSWPLAFRPLRGNTKIAAERFVDFVVCSAT